MMNQDWEPVVWKKTQDKKQHSTPSTPSTPVKEEEDKKLSYFTVDMGKKIASLRNDKKWTQEELAKKLCIPKKTIIDLEQGKEKYSGPLVSKLKKVLGNFSW